METPRPQKKRRPSFPLPGGENQRVETLASYFIGAPFQRQLTGLNLDNAISDSLCSNGNG